MSVTRKAYRKHILYVSAQTSGLRFNDQRLVLAILIFLRFIRRYLQIDIPLNSQQGVKH